LAEALALTFTVARVLDELGIPYLAAMGVGRSRDANPLPLRFAVKPLRATLEGSPNEFEPEKMRLESDRIQADSRRMPAERREFLLSSLWGRLRRPEMASRWPN